MSEPYQPRYQWKMTQLDENDPPTEFDWLGFDGMAYIGRVRKELNGPTKDKWHWAGSYPRSYKGTPPPWNAGHCNTAREATQKVEEFWDLCKQVMTPR